METHRIAIDANVLLYVYDSRDINKQNRAIEILLKKPFVTQLVIFEFMKVLERKFKREKKEITKLTIKLLTELVYPLSQHSDIHNYAHFLVQRYNYGLSDILVLSDSILNNCSVLLSEDMCNGMIVDKKIKIVNPFL